MFAEINLYIFQKYHYCLATMVNLYLFMFEIQLCIDFLFSLDVFLFSASSLLYE